MKIPRNCKIELAASTDTTRIALNDARLEIEDGKALLIACNGMILAAVPVEFEKPEKSGPVPVKAIAEARRQIGRKKSGPEILCGERCEVGDVSFKRESVDYPNWKQALPDEKVKPEYVVSLNARLLFKLSQALGSDVVVLRFRSPLDPISVTGNSDNKTGAFGVIMPRKQ